MTNEPRTLTNQLLELIQLRFDIESLKRRIQKMKVMVQNLCEQESRIKQQSNELKIKMCPNVFNQLNLVLPCSPLCNEMLELMQKNIKIREKKQVLLKHIEKEQQELNDTIKHLHEFNLTFQ